MAIKNFSKDLQKPLSEGGKRSLFLVNTVVLAKQQHALLKKVTPLKVSVYTGDMNVDAWKKDQWTKEFEENQVIVATCQIVYDVVVHGFMSLSQFNVIVFDECHHARNNHIMHRTMGLYQHVPTANRPRIIGLTGMLLSGQCEPNTVVNQIEQLENTFNATIATVRTFNEYTNVLLYSTNPQEMIVDYNETMSHHQVVTEIAAIVQQCVKKITNWPQEETRSRNADDYIRKGDLANKQKMLKKLFLDLEYQIKDLGLFGGSIAVMSVIVELEIRKRSSTTTRKRLLIRELITITEKIRSLIMEAMCGASSAHSEDEVDQLYKMFSSHKILKLIKIIRDYLAKNDSTKMKALIFVQRRHTAKCIYHLLRILSGNDFKSLPICPDFMIGNNSTLPESIEAILDNKWNHLVVQRFKKGITNLIVASSVLEEGIDLQMCNLVISYDAPESYRSYIQSKGRARMATSTYGMMVSFNNSGKFYASLRKYQEIDTILKNVRAHAHFFSLH